MRGRVGRLNLILKWWSFPLEQNVSKRMKTDHSIGNRVIPETTCRYLFLHSNKESA